MAFWKKKSEDPWDMDPNKKQNRAVYHEREIELPSEPVPQPVPRPRKQEDEGLAMPESAAELEVQEEPEIGPECPWCGKNMVRAYLLGARGSVYLTDQKPTAFLGALGYNLQDLSDEGFFTTHTSCWQCKECRKVVVDVPEPVPEDSFARWDGNPVAPPNPEEIEP